MVTIKITGENKMRIGVNLKINLSKADKAKLFKGAKGTYLDAVAFIDIDVKGQYGDNGMITQAVSKEEKEAGERGAILGNSTVFWRDDGQAQPAAASAPASADDGFDEDIPW